MLFNPLKCEIFCFLCNKWYDIYLDIEFHTQYDGSMICPENHIVGNDWDKEWLDFIKSEIPEENKNG